MQSIIKVGLLCFLLVALGCTENDCGGFERQNTNITDMEGYSIRYESDNYTATTPLEANAEIAYGQYGIAVNPVVEYYSHTINRNLVFFSLFPAAYACSPPPPQPSEEIADIAIFSNNDYRQAGSSKVIVAGDTLNSLFNVYDYYSGRIVGLPDFLIDEGLQASDLGMVLRLVVPPVSAEQYQFTVHYRLTNNEFYSITTEPVTVTP